MQINIHATHDSMHIIYVGLKCWGEISQSGDFLIRCCYQINGMTGAFIMQLNSNLQKFKQHQPAHQRLNVITKIFQTICLLLLINRLMILQIFQHVMHKACNNLIKSA